jgi:15-cis-phytoene synthase
LVAQADKVRYWSSLYAPEDRRDALFALYAFDLEIAAVGERVREPMAGEIRLQWWREALEGSRGEEAAANPVAAALLAILQRHGAGGQPMLGLIEARRFNVYDEPMATVAQLETYAQATAGTICHFAAQLLGVTGARFEEICNEAGLAQTYLKAVEAPGRGYIPTEILGHYGAERAAATATFELRAALAEMRLRARRHLNRAAELLPSGPQQILPALLPAALIKPALALMESRSYDPTRPPRLSPLRQQWLIWRAARDPERIFR